MLAETRNCRDFLRDRDRAAFEADVKTIHAVVRSLEIIGEAARTLPPWLTQKYPEAWSDMIAMRNVLAHGYWSVDLDIVWSTAVDDLPRLESAIVEILDIEGEAASEV